MMAEVSAVLEVRSRFERDFDSAASSTLLAPRALRAWERAEESFFSASVGVEPAWAIRWTDALARVGEEGWKYVR